VPPVAIRGLPQSRLLKSLEPISEYKDRSFPGTVDEYVAKLRETSTVYVGNLAFHTTEEQIHELFSSCGPLRNIVMGLDRNALTPCGFCFVEYCTRSGAEDCVKYLCGSTLDERVVRIDFDWCVRLYRPCCWARRVPAPP
jgi:nuclear cap-binding protein subunit 2